MINPVGESEMREFFNRVVDTVVSSTHAVNGLNDRLNVVEAELGNYKSANQELNNRVSDLQQVNIALSQEKTTLQDSVNRLHAQYNEEHDLRQAAQRESNDWMEVANKAERERDEAKTASNLAAMAADDSKRERDEAIAELQALRNLIAERDSLVQAKQSEIDMLRGAIQDANAQNDTLRTENVNLERSLTRAHDDYASVKGKLDAIKFALQPQDTVTPGPWPSANVG